MNPEIFIKQDDVIAFVNALTRFASKVDSADERKDILKLSGIHSDFIIDLPTRKLPRLFAQSLSARLKEYRVSDKKLDDHPIVLFLSFLINTNPASYGLEDQDAALFNKLIERGNMNMDALRARSAVGRIELRDGTGIGTGVLVNASLLLTCFHVFSNIHVQGAWVRFGCYENRYMVNEAFELDLAEYVSNHNQPDHALVKIKGEPEQQIAILDNGILTSGMETYIRMIHYPKGGNCCYFRYWADYPGGA